MLFNQWWQIKNTLICELKYFIVRIYKIGLNALTLQADIN